MAEEIKNVGNETEKSPRAYLPSIERLRLILMFFMCIDLFGFPTAFGEMIKTFCGFVPIAFFIISGFLVLRKDEDRSKRIVRSIKRSAITLLVLIVIYFVINYFYYRQQGVSVFSAFTMKRVWFNFIVLNVWQFDIGGAIWYVQALLYAYIIIWFLEKLKLMRFDWIIGILLFILTVVTGELSGIFKWNVLGYSYLAGNFLTRALPYILLGGFIQRNMEKFGAVWPGVYRIGAFAGIILMYAEMMILAMKGVPGYYGHLIGMAVTAFSVCMLAFMEYDRPGFEKLFKLSRWHTNSIYYMCPAVSTGAAFLMSFIGNKIGKNLFGFIGIVTFVICFCLALLIAFIGRTVFKKKANE